MRRRAKLAAGHAAAVPWLQIGVALAVLLLGASVYVVDRPAGAVPFFSAIGLAGIGPTLFGAVGQSLPSFAHVFAFSCLTAALLGNTRLGAAAACVSWCVINAAFELGQHGAIAPQLSAWMAPALEDVPLLMHASRYFVYGSFDPNDLAAVAIGAIAAFVAIRRIGSTSARHA